jgi:hypothetical protein
LKGSPAKSGISRLFYKHKGVQKAKGLKAGSWKQEG